MKPLPLKQVQNTLKQNGFNNRGGNSGHDNWSRGNVNVSVPRGKGIVSPGVVRQVTNAIKTANTSTPPKK